MKNDPLGAAQDQPVTDDSTIRCVCENKEDDGYTIACDFCSRWQHVACYYPGEPPEFHACLECNPRTLDLKPTVERPRRRRDQNGATERKTRRPGAKVQRRKPKEQIQAVDAHPNGLTSDRKNGTSRDQPPPAKRPKTNHRTSSSMRSGAEIPKMTSPVNSESHRALGDAPEPGVSPGDSASEVQSPFNGPRSDYFSAEYLKMWKDDPGESPLRTNLFNNISITCTLGSWIHDSDALLRATNGKGPAEVFHRVDGPFEALRLPEIVKRMKPTPQVEDHGQYPVWHYLTVESFVPKGGLVGELKGEVGHLRDYWQDARNRWPLLRHPEPFVFFHPQLPIYIDTRREGTRCRYIRRSCRPNVTMNTLISNGIEYHFCLCALENLEPGTEITIAWDPDRDMKSLIERGLNDLDPASPIRSGYLTQAEQASISDWVERVLAFHGGCACENAQTCALARLNFKRQSVVNHTAQAWPEVIKRKKSRGGGGRQASPPSAAQSVNSRAASENLAHREHEEERDESRSTSGSFPSKPQSRDITPLTHFSSDMPLATPGIELSDREKRKIAAVERTFEQLEQDHQHQARRKKRNSTNSGSAPGVNASVSHQSLGANGHHSPFRRTQNRLSVPSASMSQPATPNATVKTEYTDSSTAQGASISPSNDSQFGQANDLDTPTKPNQRVVPILTKPAYVDASTQTDAIEESWYEQPAVQPMRKPAIPLTKRILKRCHEARLRLEEEKKRTSDNTETAGLSAGDDGEGPDPTKPSGSGPHRQELAGGSDVVHDNDPSCMTQSLNVNIQKPRPPDPSSSDTNTSSHTVDMTTPKPAFLPPPPPRSTTGPAVSKDFASNSNRQTSPDLRVQLPPTPQFNPISPSTPSSSGHVIAQSPSASAPPSALFSPSIISSVAQPSPIKKKLSLSDYVSRKHKMEMSSAEKLPPHGSSTSPLGSAKLSSSPEDSKRQGTSAIQDSAATEAPSTPLEVMPTSGVPGDPRIVR